MPWMRTDKAAEYATVSTRTFRRWKKNGMRYARVDGVDLFRSEWIDEYIRQFEVKENAAREMAEAIFQKLKP